MIIFCSFEAATHATLFMCFDGESVSKAAPRAPVSLLKSVHVIKGMCVECGLKEVLSVSGFCQESMLNVNCCYAFLYINCQYLNYTINYYQLIPNYQPNNINKSMHKQQQDISLNPTAVRNNNPEDNPSGYSTSSSNQPSQQDLVDLQPDRDSLFKRVVGPKIIILVFLSLMFVSKNIYNLYVIGVPDGNPNNDTISRNTTTNGTLNADKKIPQNDSIMERMYGYCILTAVLFVLYILLVRANDRALMRKIQQEKKKIEEQEEQKVKQQQNITEIKKKIIEEKNISGSKEQIDHKKQV